MQSFIKISHGVPDTQNVQTDKRSLLLGFLKYTLRTTGPEHNLQPVCTYDVTL